MVEYYQNNQPLAYLSFSLFLSDLCQLCFFSAFLFFILKFIEYKKNSIDENARIPIITGINLITYLINLIN